MNEPITFARPKCPHFGVCGGCQYQDLSYAEQLRIKRAHLEDLLHDAHIEAPSTFAIHSAEPFNYRNRIRLRIQHAEGALRFGYNVRATTDFLPIVTCPIAAPILVATAETILSTASTDRDAAYWLDTASELELFCSDDLNRVQVTLFCAPRTKAPPPGRPGNFGSAFASLQQHAPQIAGAAAVAFDARTGPTGRTIAEAGASGLNYSIAVSHKPDRTYWITRGGFFQVNRFLLETLVRLVTEHEGQPRTGALAWDLYAGVGLFSRVLAETFARVTAVEANPTAAADLRSALGAQQTQKKLSPVHTAVEATTLDFLRRAVLDRDRPDLIVLDPPRAGAGLEACELLNRIAAPDLIYVSCDPTTLVRDLAALQPHYSITELHLVDLFPQTIHLETIAILKHTHSSSSPPIVSN